MEKISLAEFQHRLKEQGMERDHAAFVCPICKTVQSMASLRSAGVPEEKVELQIAFSCEGRWTKAGPWPSNPSEKRKSHRGCDWSLGGLFSLHELEVEKEDEIHPMFVIATTEQAEQLRANLTTTPSLNAGKPTAPKLDGEG